MNEKMQEDVKKINFRNKDNGWSNFSLELEYRTKNYNVSHKEDLYMKIFLADYILRDSCYQYSFRKKNRNSDITLADFWGINNVDRKLNDEKGLSLVIINSEKGYEFFEKIKEEVVYKEFELEDAIRQNMAILRSLIVPGKGEQIFRDFDKKRFDKVIKKYIPSPNIIKKY